MYNLNYIELSTETYVIYSTSHSHVNAVLYLRIQITPVSCKYPRALVKAAGESTRGFVLVDWIYKSFMILHEFPILLRRRHGLVN